MSLPHSEAEKENAWPVLQIPSTFIFTTLRTRPKGSCGFVSLAFYRMRPSHSKVTHVTQNGHLFAMKLQQYDPFSGE